MRREGRKPISLDFKSFTIWGEGGWRGGVSTGRALVDCFGSALSVVDADKIMIVLAFDNNTYEIYREFLQYRLARSTQPVIFEVFDDGLGLSKIQSRCLLTRCYFCAFDESNNSVHSSSKLSRTCHSVHRESIVYCD